MPTQLFHLLGYRHLYNLVQQDKMLRELTEHHYDSKKRCSIFWRAYQIVEAGLQAVYETVVAQEKKRLEEFTETFLKLEVQLKKLA